MLKQIVAKIRKKNETPQVVQEYVKAELDSLLFKIDEALKQGTEYLEQLKR